jgi:hypothetical protein
LLSDFAKLIELVRRRTASRSWRRHLQFIITTWMKRLTLNVLLSFAQWVGERIPR